MKKKSPLSLLSLLMLLAAGAVLRRGPRKAYHEAQKLIPFDAVIAPGIPYNGKAWDSVMKARALSPLAWTLSNQAARTKVCVRKLSQ